MIRQKPQLISIKRLIAALDLADTQARSLRGLMAEVRSIDGKNPITTYLPKYGKEVARFTGGDWVQTSKVSGKITGNGWELEYVPCRWELNVME